MKQEPGGGPAPTEPGFMSASRPSAVLACRCRFRAGRPPSGAPRGIAGDLQA